MRTNEKAPVGATKQKQYDTAAVVLQALKMGQVKRAELRRVTGLSDVKMRQTIHDLQTLGYPIINLSDGRGYKIADDRAELERYKAQEKARAINILTKLELMKWEDGEQEVLDV